MKVKLTKKPQSVVELTIEAEAADLVEYREQAVQQLSKDKPPKGFRPGKADEATLRRLLGEVVVERAIMDAALPGLYLAAIRQEKISPINKAEVDIKSKEPLVMQFTVEVMPEVKLGSYHKIKVKAEKVAVGDKDVEQALDNLRKHFASHKIVERPAQKGDLVEIDFTGSIDGKKSDRLSSKNHPLELGKGFLLPDFEKQLIGVKTGEEKEIKITFPKDFPQKDLANKEVVFQVKVNKVEEAELAVLDGAFAQKISSGNMKTMAALREQIKQDISGQREQQEKSRQENELLKQLDKIVKVELPAGMVQEEVEYIFARFADSLQQRGSNLSSYCVQQKTTPEKIKDGFQEEAERRIRIRLALLQIAKDEKITVPEAEVLAGLSAADQKDTRAKAIKETELSLRQALNHLLVEAVK